MNYQDNYRMFLWLHGLLCTVSMTEPLLIIPDVMQHLNDTFSNRWIGRGSTIN